MGQNPRSSAAVVRVRRVFAVLVATTVLASACGERDQDTTSLSVELAEACGRTRQLHNEITGIANEMAAAEVNASPTERARILADGFEAMIDAADDALLADQPAELVFGLERRRDAVVNEMRLEAEAFRTTWGAVTTAERSGVVAQVFVSGEKLMSETEPRVRPTTDPELVAAIAAEPACRHVIQLR